MSSLSTELAALFRRDLARLVRQLDALDDARLWQVVPGVTNSAGNLLLHLNGNLREYVGRQVGAVPYMRDRAREFAAKDVPRHELTAALAELATLIPGVLERMTEGRWNGTLPRPVNHRMLDSPALRKEWPCESPGSRKVRSSAS
jgi:hypothetical protein